MEGTATEKKTQGNNECNENPGCDNLYVVEMSKNQQEQPMSSQSLLSRKSSDLLAKLTQRKKMICDKLATKRQQLQLHGSNIESNNVGRKENEMKVLKALQGMVVGKDKPSERNAEFYLHNEGLQSGGVINGDLAIPHSKEQLKSVVEGLQELLFKLTFDDARLKSKAKKLARNISSLRNFNIFSNFENNPSISGARKQRHDSDFYQEERSNSKERKFLRNTGNKKDLSPTEMFVKYINFMLSEYFGEHQQYKIDMFKCLPAHIEDLELFATTLVQAGIGSIVETEIRVNRKNNRQAFISMDAERETCETDGIILLPVARRYAFEGDIVRAFVLHPVSANSKKINPDDIRKMRQISSHITEENNSLPLAEDEECFEDTENNRKAFVIRIIKQTELLEVVGSISFKNATTLNSKPYYKLRPHDVRLPMVYIPEDLCKEQIKTINKTDVCGMLYVVRILETNVKGHCVGELVQPVGKVGNLQAEIKAILLHNGLKDIEPYEQKFSEMYEEPMLKEPNDEYLKHREDLRKNCVFTIDPLTAKDLDDAVSIEKLSSLEYEIGVHISDVSFYLEENSELDNLVKHRANSIYLVNEVIHMLPHSLCFRCSLLPGEDKLAFSVFWKWNTEKKVLSAPRFTRSILNSCSQFAYEHAQKIIDNPTEELDRDDLPDLLNDWTPNDFKWRVLLLHEISQELKAKRYENGALSIDNQKLRFQLDPKTGEPLAYEIEDRQDANFLIEEFMLLANQSVAKFIHDRFPDISILRNHPPPLVKSMKAVKERLSNIGLELDITSSKSIHDSVERLTRESDDPKAVKTVLSALLTKPMARARYYCSEGKTLDADFRHYSLSIPIYTHFTSPIRRYPDVLVHRLLAAALNYSPPPQRTPEELHHLAKICNVQKLNAKNAGDESIELFFKRYVKAKQSITLRAVVIDLHKYSLNALAIETGHTIKMEYKSQKVLVVTTELPSSITIVEKNSKLPPIKLQLFSTLDINIVLQNEKICGYIATSKKDKTSKNKNDAANYERVRLQSNSMSEQEDNNTQTAASIP